jgi:16S rRNA (guanine1516-N2)-methyltransferase
LIVNRVTEAHDQAALLAPLISNIGGNIDFTVVSDGIIIDWHDVSDHLQFKHSYNETRFLKRVQQSDQALLKACNNKQRSIKSLLDLTGGWGIDSFILAYHGLRVTMLERNELVYHVSRYALNYARSIKQTSAAANRIDLIHSSSIEFLLAQKRINPFDCIYLDPMFPDHKSTAKPAKEMQILQQITQNQNIEECFKLALEKAAKRVVVKRPAKSKPFSSLAPDLVYKAKTIRFDVYLTNNSLN